MADLRHSEAHGRAVVRERSGGRCEGCRCCTATSWQHRVKRGQGGSWSPSNGIDLCGSGTTGCHGDIEHNPDWAYLLGTGLRSGADVSTEPAYLHTIAGTGWWLLNEDGTYTRVDEDDITHDKHEAARRWDNRPHNQSRSASPASPLLRGR